MAGHFTNSETGFVTLIPEFNLSKQIDWIFHVDDRSQSSSTNDMIIGQDLLGKSGIIFNFNETVVTCDTDTVFMKDRGTLNIQDLFDSQCTSNPCGHVFSLNQGPTCRV